MGEPRDEGGGERRLTGPERREGSMGALWTLQRVAVTGGSRNKLEPGKRGAMGARC